MIARPAPDEDLDSAPFWAGLREHRVLVQRCDNCGTYRFPPRSICNRCLDRRSTWTECSGRATVASWIVAHQVFHPAFADVAPYAVLLARLVEQADLVMYGGFVGDPAGLTPDLALESVFEDSEEGVTRLNWRAASPTKASS